MSNPLSMLQYDAQFQEHLHFRNHDNKAKMLSSKNVGQQEVNLRKCPWLLIRLPTELFF
jgi:hypothetical protein